MNNDESKKATENQAEGEEEKAEQSEKTEKAEKSEKKEKKEKKSKKDSSQKQLEQTKEQLLRTAAEYENFRKRSAKEKEAAYTNAKGDVIAEFLSVIDNLERAVNSDKADFESLKAGVEMTLNGFNSALEKMNVESYGEEGDIFDPNLHNAVAHTDDDEAKETYIAQVFQKGYKINDRVIRPAMVTTAG